ncbi:MAG: PEGA domain-containing protein, partial [Desulfobacteraceae bacterium]
DIEITPGEHMVRVDKKGYETYEKSIFFKKGQSVALHVFLSKKLYLLNQNPTLRNQNQVKYGLSHL